MRAKKPRRTRSPLLSVHDVVSPRIHETVDGVRIGHLSDIHVRVGVKPKKLIRAVEMMNALKPDLVVLTGDYVCFSPRPLPGLTAALKDLAVPAYATLGNHDHWSGASHVVRALESAGIDVLTNEHRTVQVRGGKLHIVGVDDSVTRHHDPDKAFAGVPSGDGATRVVLAHDPSFAEALVRYKPAVVFSGHTHGGQVFIKRVTPYMAQRIGMKYLSGFFDLDGTTLYVSRGLGESLPLRFRAPSEVTQLTLRSAVANAVTVAAA